MKNNKKYLVGIINIKNYYHIFSKNDLADIKKKINILEMKYKFTQIEQLNFLNKTLDDKELIFIFQYNFNNLVYLNLENNNITS